MGGELEGHVRSPPRNTAVSSATTLLPQKRPRAGGACPLGGVEAWVTWMPGRSHVGRSGIWGEQTEA